MTADHWFKFLGFSIKGKMISLSSSRIKTFQKEIERRTIRNRNTTLTKAVNSVNRYLYKGNGEFSWATQILPVCNVRKDLDELNMLPWIVCGQSQPVNAKSEVWDMSETSLTDVLSGGVGVM